ncbi:MAG TPA: Crp/Fnr family transcriptional regulator [Candidatus Saccharimonadales bacterium]|nr:Crp/Fnr family transcriptional regulator [Candidatus Saccharimonadales bacterium]
MDKSVAAKVENFFAFFALQRFDKGHLFACAGEDLPGVMYLVKGEVIEYDITDSGTQLVLNTFKPPAFFPVSWALNKTPNQFFFEAATKSVLLRVAPPEEVVAFLHANPDIVIDLLSRVYRGTDGLLKRMSFLMSSSAHTRLIYELIIECRRFGKQQSDGSYVLTRHEGELGTRAGLSRETVNRELSDLKSRGVVIVKRESITVTDIAKLEKELDNRI